MTTNGKEPALYDPLFLDLKPETAFGRRLLELRRQNIAAGEPPLTEEELDCEIAERRGGVIETKSDANVR
jgi:hypothetical protein